MTKQPKVWLSIPHTGSVVPGVLQACLQATSRSTPLYVKDLGFSIATHTFNMLWSQAYNQRKALGLTHFAMIHSDVHPAENWLDTMLDEMDRTGADVLSAVIAIKDCKGLTSTGLRDPATKRTRRLTMTEVMGLPATFAEADTDDPANALAINTGLWVCRFDGDWPARFPGFRIDSAMTHDPASDTLTPRVDPEDWIFGEWCQARGLKVMATRAVKVWHTGTFQYPNDAAWGEWPTDREYFSLGP